MMPLESLIEALDSACVQGREGLLRRLDVGPWLFNLFVWLLVQVLVANVVMFRFGDRNAFVVFYEYKL
jgi:hypothetical protein